MSAINQMLLDLEKRRASSAERGALPNHVRTLPDGGPEVHWWWIAGGGVAAVAAVAGAWGVLSGFIVAPRQPAAVVAPARGTEITLGKAVTASTGVTADAQPREENEGAAPASRLSLELSGPPAAVAGYGGDATPAEAGAPAVPVPAARVVERADAATATREPPARPSVRPETAKAPPVVAAAKASTGTTEERPAIQKQVRQPTPRELAENEYRKATAWLQQGRLAEAQEGFQAALNLYSGHHGARQAMVGLLLGEKKLAEAERVLQEGVELAPAQTGFAMTLARLQVDRDDTPAAIATLRKSQDYALGNADYLAFLAALLQRQGRHEEAIEQFRAALRLKPASGVWLLGLGLSLQATNRAAEAQDAYRRARATNSLNPELAAFADQRLRQLQ